ncbi:MAG: hypothetical protein KF891_24645 [Rhizobacter sp.]|nr:hypothetical protein [Rhizobacter sp.]
MHTPLPRPWHKASVRTSCVLLVMTLAAGAAWLQAWPDEASLLAAGLGRSPGADTTAAGRR